MIRVNRAEPRIQITLATCGVRPVGVTNLYMKRVGDVQDFAVYAPLEILGDVYTFQFDELLFSKLQGRYEGRLFIGATKVATVFLEYKDITKVVAMENISV